MTYASARTVIVCGHWSALGLRMEPHLLALDSGCVWGEKLTAVRLDHASRHERVVLGCDH